MTRGCAKSSRWVLTTIALSLALSGFQAFGQMGARPETGVGPAAKPDFEVDEGSGAGAHNWQPAPPSDSPYDRCRNVRSISYRLATQRLENIRWGFSANAVGVGYNTYPICVINDGSLVQHFASIGSSFQFAPGPPLTLAGCVLRGEVEYRSHVSMKFSGATLKLNTSIEVASASTAFVGQNAGECQDYYASMHDSDQFWVTGCNSTVHEFNLPLAHSAAPPEAGMHALVAVPCEGQWLVILEFRIVEIENIIEI